MRYQFAEWVVDRDAGLLTRNGQPVNVTRKILDCIDHLIRNRDRVVGYDELIYKIWGHGDVHNQRLARVVLDVRKLLGDDGHNQQFIRTANGLGYQWVMPVIDIENGAEPHPTRLSNATVEPEGAAAPLAQSDLKHRDRGLAPGKTGTADMAAKAQRRRYGLPALGTLVLLVAATGVYMANGGSEAMQPAKPRATALSTPTLEKVEAAMRLGEYDQARDIFAALPAQVLQSPEGALTEIQLDHYRGRFRQARSRLDQQLALAQASGDPVWQSRLHTVEAVLNIREPALFEKRLKSAERAVDLLEPLGENAPIKDLAKALLQRGSAYVRSEQFEQAEADLQKSEELFEKADTPQEICVVRGTLARLWRFSGRIEKGAEEFADNIARCERSGNFRYAQISANALAEAQIEMLRFHEALETNDYALSIMSRTPKSRFTESTLDLRAQALARLGRYQEARRLLEEAELLVGDDATSVQGAGYLLETGNNSAALKGATDILSKDLDKIDNIQLRKEKEDAILIWTTASHRMQRNRGKAVPPAPAMARLLLQDPISVPGLVASGRMAIMQGELQRAETILTDALYAARQKGLRNQMILAAEPLVELLIDGRRTGEADRLLDNIRFYDPRAFDGDYRFIMMRYQVALRMPNHDEARSVYPALASLRGERPMPDAPPASGRSAPPAPLSKQATTNRG